MRQYMRGRVSSSKHCLCPLLIQWVLFGFTTIHACLTVWSNIMYAENYVFDGKSFNAVAWQRHKSGAATVQIKQKQLTLPHLVHSCPPSL